MAGPLELRGVNAERQQGASPGATHVFDPELRV